MRVALHQLCHDCNTCITAHTVKKHRMDKEKTWISSSIEGLIIKPVCLGPFTIII